MVVVSLVIRFFFLWSFVVRVVTRRGWRGGRSSDHALHGRRRDAQHTHAHHEHHAYPHTPRTHHTSTTSVAILAQVVLPTRLEVSQPRQPSSRHLDPLQVCQVVGCLFCSLLMFQHMLDSLSMMVCAKFDVPQLVTPSSLSGSSLGLSAPLLANFETDLKDFVKAVWGSVSPCCLHVCRDCRRQLCRETSVVCPKGALPPGASFRGLAFASTFQDDFMGQDTFVGVLHVCCDRCRLLPGRDMSVCRPRGALPSLAPCAMLRTSPCSQFLEYFCCVATLTAAVAVYSEWCSISGKGKSVIKGMESTSREESSERLTLPSALLRPVSFLLPHERVHGAFGGCWACEVRGPVSSRACLHLSSGGSVLFDRRRAC